jgi:VWFA-related protein
VYTERQARVLNDAVLQAALDLARRDPTRRKVLFIISNGEDYRSSASYGEVLKVLLTNQISVYAVGVGGAAIPGYAQAQKIHLPRMGYGNILPKYASATGGEVFSEFDQSAIERAYSRLTEEARNQYTIGYTTRATPSSQYRDIEVIVDRPDLRVTAKQGYYPLPPPRPR